ncbi:hypothetical protein [Paenibacillus crassostreae]|uniref:hypothetical protein n=1 Tax=Paenibacillus crassostreae TaxID=1763538 RepID=UPI0008385A91|nr:hypothetical protein [Paenibacillus crassostreae]AOZ93640.1 hypothetical protein LPB68_16525 [Paenibacillus crassostreae]
MTLDWEMDINWKVRTQDNRICIIRDHNWSFAAWEIGRLNDQIRNKSLVVHVDAHLDNAIDGALVTGLQEATTIEQIIEVCSSYDSSLGQTPKSNMMHIDNFIWSSLVRGTIEEVIYVSRDNQELNTIANLSEQNDPQTQLVLEKLPPDCNYRTTRFMNIDDFLMSSVAQDLGAYLGERTAILDLDIDVFNDSDRMFDPELIPMHQVREYTKKLYGLYQWDMITIAISPSYCGGILEAQLLLENVLKALDIDVQSTITW